MARRKTIRRARTPRKGAKYAVRIVFRQQPGFDHGALALNVTHANGRLRVALGINRISPDDWDEQRQRLAGRSLQAITVNTELDQILQGVQDYFERERDPNNPATLDGLRKELFPNSQGTPKDTDAGAVTECFTRFKDSHTISGKAVAKNTRLSYGVVLKAWQAFERHTRTRYRIHSFRVVGTKGDRNAREILTAFDRFLAEHGPNGTPLVDNTRRKYLKIFSTFLRWAEVETGIPLLRGINTGGEIVARSSFALTETERLAIEAIELPAGSNLHHVRNGMVMALYTGLRFSEWNRVNPVLWREQSQPVTMPKTGRTALVVHRDPVRRVLREYAETGWPPVLRHNSKVNEAMKDIARMAGLTRLVAVTYAFDGQDRSELLPLHDVLSTHTLRRTKVTLDLDGGANLRDVCIETGQDEATARKHYDRPNAASHVRKLGVQRFNEEVEE